MKRNRQKKDKKRTGLIGLGPLLQLGNIIIKLLCPAISLFGTALLEFRVVPLPKFLIGGSNVFDQGRATNGDGDAAVRQAASADSVHQFRSIIAQDSHAIQLLGTYPIMTFTHNPARDMVWSVFSDAENGD